VRAIDGTAPLAPDAVLHVLRLTSVFEPPPGSLSGDAASFDPIGGLQNHAAALSRCLDESGVVQTVVTSRQAAARGSTPLGQRTRVVRVGLRLRHLRQLWAVCAVLTVLRPGGRVHLVHAHQGEDLATLPLARLAARVHRCPLVVTLHNSLRHTTTGRSIRAVLLHRIGGAVERSSLLRADAVVVLTERAAGFEVADGVPLEKISVIPSGFDPQLFAGQDPDPFPGVGRPRIGYVGRLAPQKRPDLVVAAFERMREPAQLLVVGDGPARARVEAAVRRSPAVGRIGIHGFVEHSAVPAVLRSLDVLILPSTYEELGSVLVEALAVGLPVVATRTGGIPEVVTDGVTGLLVPPDDAAALADALDRLVGDPALLQRLAAGAAERARDFTWPALAERVRAVYADVLARGPGP
jgi:2-deoxystreptamine N-acetyl-D-glucosaminyltransferase/2-deoxystreptamine glucosyltransferase